MAQTAKNRRSDRVDRIDQTSGMTYIGDNLARKEQEQVQTRPVTREEIRARRSRERSRSMSLPAVLAMVAVVGITTVLCLNYLSIQNSINARLKNISALETEYETIVKTNEALELSIDPYEDYAVIYDTAVNELGMQQATEEQIIWITPEESEYVKQYEAVPTK